MREVSFLAAAEIYITPNGFGPPKSECSMYPNPALKCPSNSRLHNCPEPRASLPFVCGGHSIGPSSLQSRLLAFRKSLVFRGYLPAEFPVLRRRFEIPSAKFQKKQPFLSVLPVSLLEINRCALLV